MSDLNKTGPTLIFEMVNALNNGTLTAGALSADNVTIAAPQVAAQGADGNTTVVVAAKPGEGYMDSVTLAYDRLNLGTVFDNNGGLFPTDRTAAKTSDFFALIQANFNITLTTDDIIDEALANPGVDGVQTFRSKPTSLRFTGNAGIAINYPAQGPAPGDVTYNQPLPDTFKADGENQWDTGEVFIPGEYATIVSNGDYSAALTIGNLTYNQWGPCNSSGLYTVSAADTDQLLLAIGIQHANTQNDLTADVTVTLAFGTEGDADAHVTFPLVMANNEVFFAHADGTTKLDEVGRSARPTAGFVVAYDIATLAAQVPGMAVNGAGEPSDPVDFVLTVKLTSDGSTLFTIPVSMNLTNRPTS